MLKWKLNLQFFSEPLGGELQDPPPQDPPTPKTFTEEEVQKMLQSEADKRVSQALQTAKLKWEEEQKEKLAEAEKLAKMSEEERQRALFDKKVKEFEEKEKAFQRKELLAQTVTELANKKLPVVFAQNLMGDTAEETLQNINSFSDTWAQALENEVNERLKGNAPKVSTKTPDTVYNPWDRQTLNLTKQAEILKTNPELAKQLMAQAKK